jgi:hypothetical protein
LNVSVTIKNNTNNFNIFRINAVFEDDVRIGLLENKILEGYEDDLEMNVFTILPNEIIEYKKIIFIGKFAGTYQKYSKALSEIYIIIIEQ